MFTLIHLGFLLILQCLAVLACGKSAMNNFKNNNNKNNTYNLLGLITEHDKLKQNALHIFVIVRKSKTLVTAVIGAECWSLGLLATKHWNVFTSYNRTTDTNIQQHCPWSAKSS